MITRFGTTAPPERIFFGMYLPCFIIRPTWLGNTLQRQQKWINDISERKWYNDIRRLMHGARSQRALDMNRTHFLPLWYPRMHAINHNYTEWPQGLIVGFSQHLWPANYNTIFASLVCQSNILIYTIIIMPLPDNHTLNEMITTVTPKKGSKYIT